MFKMEMEGMGELSKQIVGDKTGYSTNQGQRKDLTPEEFAEKKATISTFDELKLMNKADLVLDGIEPVNGSDAYIIVNGKSKLFYDVKSGLKVMTSTSLERNGQKMTTSMSFGDYKEVKGVKVPYNIVTVSYTHLDVYKRQAQLSPKAALPCAIAIWNRVGSALIWAGVASVMPAAWTARCAFSSAISELISARLA